MRTMAIHFLLLPALVVGLISSPRLVVLIPAYNEADRIEKTLESYEQFLTSSPLWQNNCEIVVVDDGSKDETVLKVKDFTSNILIQCISLDTNQGKGSALARGINYIQETTKANNEPKSIIILTQDADGSGDLKYLEDMYRKLQELLDSSTKEEEVMVMGNRNYNLFSSRGITRWGFQTCVSIIMGGLGVQDSQCGYKLMTLSTATRLYKDLNLNGWAHDVEVLFRAKLYKIPIAQIDIDWQDKDGSKVVESGVIKVSARMLLDILRLRWEYSVTKAWKLPDTKQYGS